MANGRVKTLPATELDHFLSTEFVFNEQTQGTRVSRKLRPRKLRPQTRKTQTLGCLENPDLENSDPRVSRKLRPEKLRPSGCLENSDPKNKTYLHRVKTVHSVMKIICREKKKQLAVLDTCNDHENYTQHSYRFFFSLSYKPSLYPQRVVSLEAIREGPASRDSSGYNLSRLFIYFEKFSRFSKSYSKYIQAFY